MKLEGVLPAHVTPFDDSGEVDFDRLEQLYDHLIDGGVDGLVVAGCTGEAATLTHEEHLQLIEGAVEVADGRVPVVAGTGSNSTREALRLTEGAEDAGADAAMLITPYYNRPPQRGLFRHYREVAESTSLPLVLYNVPSRTGVDLKPETVLELAEIDNVVALKEACGHPSRASRVLEEAPEDFRVLSGDDGNALATLALGGSGVVSVAANLAPDRTVELVEAASTGDLEEARRLHRELSPLFRAIFHETNPIPVKRALRMLDLDMGPLREPLVEASRETEDVLRDALGGLDLL